MSVRVAFATTDGCLVNEHFGHAEFWDIYDIDKEPEFVGTRKVHAECSCHNSKIFDNMLDSLADCEVLFVAKIGEEAATRVIKSGKRVFEAAGDLYLITKELVDRHILEPQKSKNEIRRAS